MKLIIAEKPSLGKAIAEWLGAQHKHRTHIECKNGYTVTWLFGHLLELYDAHEYDPAWKSWSSPLPIHPQIFKLKLRDDEGIKIQYTAIAGLLKQCDEVVNAGDPDREGQLLVDELLEYANNLKPVNRLWLAAIDDKSIAKAFDEIKSNIDYHGYKLAAETRQRADWLIGINYTRAFTKTFQQHGYANVITIGRVQTPTLKLIIDRDYEIKNFIAKDFYMLEAIFNNETQEVKAKFIVPNHIKELMDDGRLLDRACLDDVAKQINNKNAVVANYTKSNKVEYQPLLYSLSELQTIANKKYGFSAQQVLDVAQLLYENKLTSYPRTDCQYMPESQFNDAQDILNKLQNITTYKNLTPINSIKSKVWNDKKVSAHHAIVPTGANLDKLENILAGLGKHQDVASKIFDLICIQYFAQFYPEFKFDEVEILFEVGEYMAKISTRCPYQFTAIGKTITDNGWKELFGNKKTADNDSDDENDDNKDNNQILPALTIGQNTTCRKQIVISKKTTKPKAYTEGTLIQTMSNLHNKIPELVKQLGHDAHTTDKLIKQYQTILKETAGLGTEATRASIIETLKNRVLIQTKGKTLVSTELGQSVINSMLSDSVREQLSFLSSPLTTAEYEQYLDEIVGSSNNNQQPAVNNFWDKFTPQLNKISGFANLELNIPINTNAHKCPNCATTDVISVLKALTGQYGKYWKCSICNSNYKDLNNQPLLMETPKAPAKITGDKCPDCSSELVEREGKFGKFITCSNYPKCKWSPPKAEKSASVKTDEICIKCGNGMVIRESKVTNTKFLACSAFPKCKHVVSL